METAVAQCCVLDVRPRGVTACLMTPRGRETRAFVSLAEDLLDLREWLADAGCAHVAVADTSVYWEPLYTLLDVTGMGLFVVDARHVDAGPGREPHAGDAEWIADMLQRGVLRATFVPDETRRDLHELARYRGTLAGERLREIGRAKKILESANVPLASLDAHPVAIPSRAPLEAEDSGTSIPRRVAGWARGRLKKPNELEQVLQGITAPHQRHLLAAQLRHIAFLDQEITGVEAETEKRLHLPEAELQRPGAISESGHPGAEEITAPASGRTDRVDESDVTSTGRERRRLFRIGRVTTPVLIFVASLLGALMIQYIGDRPRVAAPTRALPDNKESKVRYAQARLLAQAGRLKDAQDEYLRILLADPTDAEAMRGLIAVRRGLAGEDAALLRQQAGEYRLMAGGVKRPAEPYSPVSMAQLATASSRAALEIDAAPPNVHQAPAMGASGSSSGGSPGPRPKGPQFPTDAHNRPNAGPKPSAPSPSTGTGKPSVPSPGAPPAEAYDAIAVGQPSTGSSFTPHEGNLVKVDCVKRSFVLKGSSGDEEYLTTPDVTALVRNAQRLSGFCGLQRYLGHATTAWGVTEGDRRTATIVIVSP